MSAEKDVVSRFKLECGASFTSRLEGMFKDMESSIEMWNGFRQELKDAELLKTRIKLGATVISSGIWPHPPSIDAKLPSLVDNMESAFEKYYVDKHSGRLLSWNHALGSVIMKASFKAGAKELQVSIPQALILLAFANEDRLTYNAIQKKTGLADAELQDILLSLCDAHRHQVLISEVSAEGHIKKNDFFAVNDSFTSRLHRIRLISSGTKDKIDAKAVVGTILVEDRQHQIDAAIVRLLKQEKRKSIQDVVAAVKAKLNLSVLDADIDRRIESLIERDFIVKDKENLAFLLYVL
jgi:cullin-4